MNEVSPVELLGLSGSLRASSSNTALLHATSELAPDHVEVAVYDGLGGLPHFDPDVEQSDHLPEPVSDFRASVAQADGLVISCPEYAHGVPGTFKNGLDWLVGGTGFAGLPVALFNTAPRATHAQDQLRDIVSTMAGEILEAASVTVPLSGQAIDAQGIVADEEVAGSVRDAVVALAEEIG